MAVVYVPRPPIDDPWQGKSSFPPLIFNTSQIPPLKPHFWKYDYDDAAFWLRKSAPLPPLSMPVGGGFPFLPRFWKNNYDDAAFWSGTPNRSIPETDELVGGGFPFKPPYWKFNNDDPPFWDGQRTISVFQNNLLGNHIIDTGKMPLPVNCVMMGDQIYSGTGRTFEGPAKTKLTFKPRMWSPKDKS